MKTWILRMVLLPGLLCAAAAPAGARPGAGASFDDLMTEARGRMSRGEIDPAIQSLTLAREASPADAAVYALLGQAYVKQGAEPMALLQFQKSIELDSTQTEVRLQWAGLLAKSRRWQEAGRQYQHVLRQDPANDAAAQELGRLYLKAKQPEQAAKVLQPYIERHPDDEELAGGYLAALESAGRWEDLAGAATHVLAAHPDWLPAGGIAGV